MHQSNVTASAPAVSLRGHAAASGSSGLAEDMETRLIAMERSINRLIPLVRKVLYTVTAGRESE
jgi:hypothetical protein